MFVERPPAPVGEPGASATGGTPLRSLTLPARPFDPAAVAAALLDELRRRLDLPGLGYAEPPAPLPDGWECYLYTFRLRGPGLPPAWDRPLVLRIHADRRGVPHARREFAAPRYLAGLGYPVPRPLLLEESGEAFGGPFLIDERVEGWSLLHALLHRPWNLLGFAGLMADAHARLHALPVDAFPAPPGPFLDRHLTRLGEVIDGCGLRGLAPGLDWLRRHRPEPPPAPSVLHLDFHPLNLIERADGSLAVLDWTYADLGDAHADVAMTRMLLECVPGVGAGWWERLVVGVGRPVLAWLYLRAYRCRRPLDEGRLCYFEAWAALERLVRYENWLRRGAAACDCKPDVTAHLTPELLEAFARWFRGRTGVALRL